MIMYAALCHDFGKAKATIIKDGDITSYRHEVVQCAISKKIFKTDYEYADDYSIGMQNWCERICILCNLLLITRN